jgi:hypothetical protein
MGLLASQRSFLQGIAVIVSTSTCNREKLTKPQQDFLVKVVPLARKIQEWTLFKSSFLNIKCPEGILASITIADIILSSEWGTHPIARPEFNNKYSNNLCLNKAGESWKGKFHIYKDQKYRAYKDWRDFGINLSDDYCFSRDYDHVLGYSREEDQINALSVLKADHKQYAKVISLIVEYYFLSEFNVIL